MTPCESCPTEVGLDEVMRDPLVLGRTASGGGKDVVDQLFEPVMRDDHGATPCFEAVPGQASKSCRTRPWTSVSRMSRPPWKYVKSVWSKPSRCKIVACKSWTWTLFLDGRVAEVVGRPISLAPLDAAARQPGGETARAMVAPLAALAGGRPAELAGPDHQGLIQQPAALQVGQEGRDRLVGLAAVELVVLVDVAMGVPVLVVVAAAGVDLHEPDPSLDQPTRQQAAPAEPLGPGVVEPVEPLRLRRFACEVDGLGGTRLHSEGQLVAGDAGRQLGVVGAGCAAGLSLARRSSWLRC